ncbi:UNVERIFIED_CONTAM: hypothetical protein PYX00_004269 [Menopon gallinae]|uniref:Uncharacterized protein n=1 Tax=Menopon gallinae TaxID=328185 RepID=A0AAW2I4Z4_9NEOP
MEGENVPKADSHQSAASKSGKKRPGKASKAKRSEDFRIKMNQRQYEARRKEIEKNFFSDEEMAAVEESLRAMKLTVQPRAIPMTVATCGVGFASAIEYSRMTTTWNIEAIEVICTIYQYYRVNMFLLYYKLYLASRDQSEMLSYPLEGVMIMTEDVRQVVAPIAQIPIAMTDIKYTRQDGPLDWDLSEELRPEDQSATLPTANLLGWARAEVLTPEPYKTLI